MEDQASSLRKWMGGAELPSGPAILVFERETRASSLGESLRGWFESDQHLCELEETWPGALAGRPEVLIASLDELDQRLLRWHSALFCVIVLTQTDGGFDWATSMLARTLEQRPNGRIGVVCGAPDGLHSRELFALWTATLARELADRTFYLGHYSDREEESSGGWIKRTLLHSWKEDPFKMTGIRLVARRVIQAGFTGRFRKEPAQSAPWNSGVGA